MKEILPDWFNRKAPTGAEYEDTHTLVKKRNLNTVCESAKCPNIGECFAKKRATFLILGNTCTRNCGFCGIRHGEGEWLDPDEPKNIAKTISNLYLKYIVVTSVTRDDLPDGGAGHFAKVVKEIRKVSSEIKIEVLTPDFKGDKNAIRAVLESGPDVFSHNMETVKSLYTKARPEAGYIRSLELLKTIKDLNPGQVTKSGFMVGLGESEFEIDKLMADIVKTDCDILTIGQYLRPSVENLPVHSYVKPEQFEKFKKQAERKGFKNVVSGPFVRSSYMADML